VHALSPRAKVPLAFLESLRKPIMRKHRVAVPQRPTKLLRQECDFLQIRDVTELTACVNYEFHREAALEGHEPAQKWLEREYPGWGGLPFNKVPGVLRRARLKSLKEQQCLEEIGHLLPTLEEIKLITPEAYEKAIAAGQPFIPLPCEITAKQLSKVEGLTKEKYSRLMAERYGDAPVELMVLKRDHSLPIETFLKQIRWLLEKSQVGKPINQERGKSSTVEGLRILLKALVIYRLLGRGGLSVAQVQVIRATEQRWKGVLFSSNREQRYRDAQNLADSVLKSLKKGEFRETVQKFLASRQARKLLSQVDL
jgi:hypothetical protein